MQRLKPCIFFKRSIHRICSCDIWWRKVRQHVYLLFSKVCQIESLYIPRSASHLHQPAYDLCLVRDFYQTHNLSPKAYALSTSIHSEGFGLYNPQFTIINLLPVWVNRRISSNRCHFYINNLHRLQETSLNFFSTHLPKALEVLPRVQAHS